MANETIKNIVIFPVKEIIVDKQDLDDENVKRLMISIENQGLINPITIGPDKKIIAGRHRLEAFKRLKMQEIPCCISNNPDPEIVRIHENTLRANRPLLRKLADAEYLIQKYGTKKGRPSQAVENDKDKNTVELRDLSGDAEFIVTSNGLFSSDSTYKHAKKIACDCIPEVIREIDNGAMSISFAYDRIVISKTPKNKQLSLLYKLGDDAARSVDKKLLNRDIHERRRAKRKKICHIPYDPTADTIYSVIRIAPNWDKEIEEDIQRLPVRNYTKESAAIAIECPNEKIAEAIRAIEAWGFTYSAMISCYSTRKQTEEPKHLYFTDQRSWHIIIGRLDPNDCAAFTTKLSPVFNKQDPHGSLLEILGDLWQDKKNKRLDMSATEPRAGWKIWKLDYVKKDES